MAALPSSSPPVPQHEMSERILGVCPESFFFSYSQPGLVCPGAKNGHLQKGGWKLEANFIGSGPLMRIVQLLHSEDPTARWSTTLSPKVNLSHAINFRGRCGANWSRYGRDLYQGTVRVVHARGVRCSQQTVNSHSGHHTRGCVPRDRVSK